MTNPNGRLVAHYVSFALTRSKIICRCLPGGDIVTFICIAVMGGGLCMLVVAAKGANITAIGIVIILHVISLHFRWSFFPHAVRILSFKNRQMQLRRRCRQLAMSTRPPLFLVFNRHIITSPASPPLCLGPPFIFFIFF